ncbi:hypothetical protein MKW98_001034 [Papaver atlanticum]|uniref:Uncharacterized protein n=1 Tax=Papaver atlanticum TaxID=357466 RepID=A0AAD4TBD5_9MAGN|nr:hypothetical protein MKW98_001034 [Papaver atlanticum]
MILVKGNKVKLEEHNYLRGTEVAKIVADCSIIICSLSTYCGMVCLDQFKEILLKNAEDLNYSPDWLKCEEFAA